MTIILHHTTSECEGSFELLGVLNHFVHCGDCGAMYRVVVRGDHVGVHEVRSEHATRGSGDP